MMLRPALLIIALLGLPGLASAQSIGEPIPGRAALKPRPAPAQQAPRGARSCPEYGAGFVRLEGSTTCVRMGGGVRVEIGKSSRRYGSNADAMLYGEARSATSLGEVRAVVSGRVRRDTLNDGFQRW
ncbi:porin [Bosea sp. TWI1241]|uniref:porin n=1 Tax=Bosea sp. TWI1241 TaxID=3148904 RepID=UPI00320BA9CB